jgi:Protein of unknown function (DUF3306)
MNVPDNFLSRWSRRKREAADAPPKEIGDEQTLAPGVPGETVSPPSESAAAPKPKIDVGNLPPIESIGAETDISAFMQAGVPSALRHAALRRVWSTDPAIRDFMGLTENYWDGVGPAGIPGFGDLDPGLDVKRLVSELFGETIPEATKDETSVSPVATAKSTETTETEEAQAPKSAHAPVAAEAKLSRPVENGASQKPSAQTSPERKIARRHGGATPE